MPTTDLRPKPRDFEIMQGDSFELPFVIRQPPAEGEPPETGDPVDLTNSVISGGGRKVGSNTTVDFVIDGGNDDTGAGTAKWTKETTAELAPGVYDYNVKWVDSTGFRSTIARGTVTITAEVPT
jgi:hypothetical protein